jgi:hypothetical protein
MIDDQAIFSISGKRLPCKVDSVCVHGDVPTAVTVAKAARDGLEGRSSPPIDNIQAASVDYFPLLAWRNSPGLTPGVGLSEAGPPL